MAACENPHNILDKPLPPEIPTFLGPLSPSWNQIAAMKPLQKSSFAEIFGDLLLKEPESFSSSAFSSSAASLYSDSSSSSSSSSSASSSAASSADSTDTEAEIEMLNGEINKSPGSDLDPDELIITEDLEERPPVVLCRRHLFPPENRCSEWKRSKMIRAAFPPPISCIGRSGKPWVLFKSYRENGRFILKEIRIPTQEFMHSCRKDGRLKLHIIQSDDEIPDEDEDDDEEKTEEVDDTTEVEDDDDDDDDAESINEF